MVKCVIFHPTSTLVGGILNASLAHAIGFKENGYEVAIVTGSVAMYEKAISYDIKVFYNKFYCSSIGLFLLLLDKEIFAWRDAEYIIHAGSRSWFLGIILFSQNKQYVIFHNNKIGGRRRFQNWLVLSQSHYLELKSLFPSKNIFKIKNAILTKDKPIRTKISSFEEVIIGFLGEHQQVKGLDILILALSEVKDRNIKLLLGGLGPETKKLKNLSLELGIESKIEWLGWVEDLDYFFSQIDVLIIPSREESFGLVIIEAMSRGCPVIATSSKGPLELITPNYNGYLIPLEDPHALARGIEKFIKIDKETRTEVSNNCISFSKQFLPKSVIKELIDLITIKESNL